MFTDELFQLMATCDVEKRDPCDEIIKKGGTMLVRVVRAGLMALAKNKNYRVTLDEKIKERDPKRHAKLQKIETEYLERHAAATREINNKFVKTMNSAIANFKKSIFEEWMVLGDLPLGKATKDILLRAANKEREVAGEASKRVQFYVKLASISSSAGALQDTVALHDVDAIHDRIFGRSQTSRAA